VENATVAVKEWEGDVIFLHEVRKGAADRSYGVQVARLAGLPAAVIERAKVVLEALEKGEREGGLRQKTLIDDLPLFAMQAQTMQASTQKAVHSPVVARLAETHPDELSPKDALALIYELKELSRS
jgi:DNA mismatch repair protein MutS